MCFLVGILVVSSMSVVIVICLVLVTQILYAAVVKMVLIVNVTMMVCHVMVLLLVYATMLNVYIEPVIVITCHVTVVLCAKKELMVLKTCSAKWLKTRINKPNQSVLRVLKQFSRSKVGFSRA